MSEQPTETTTPTTPPAPPPAPQAFNQADVDRIVADRIARERAKFAGFDDLKAKADEYDKLSEAQKTEQQRQADALARAQRDAEAARADALRYKAAATHGIAPDYFDLLGSGDEETVAARAERLGTLLKQSAQAEQLKAELDAVKAGKPVTAPLNGRPVEQLKPGATPADNQTEDDVLYNQLFGG